MIPGSVIFLFKFEAIIAPRDSESVFKWIESSSWFKSYEADKRHDDKPVNEVEDILDEELDFVINSIDNLIQ